jgi:hypothetical protein
VIFKIQRNLSLEGNIFIWYCLATKIVTHIYGQIKK